MSDITSPRCGGDPARARVCEAMFREKELPKR